MDESLTWFRTPQTAINLIPIALSTVAESVISSTVYGEHFLAISATGLAFAHSRDACRTPEIALLKASSSPISGRTLSTPKGNPVSPPLAA